MACFNFTGCQLVSLDGQGEKLVDKFYNFIRNIQIRDCPLKNK